MDAFYASVEVRDHPQWRGKPVAVAYAGARSVICAASYEARRFGIGSAMPLSKALRSCPELIVAPPRMSLYAEISQGLREIYNEYSQQVEPLALDECYLELTTPQPGQQVMEIRRRIQARFQLPASAGIGPNKYVAKVASGMAKPNGQRLIPPDQVCNFLWPLAVEKLWGVGPVTASKLRNHGWHRIEQVAQESPERLYKVLGKLGPEIHRLAWGLDDRAVESSWQAKSLSAEHTFERDEDSLARLTDILQSQAQELERRLRRRQLLAQLVVLKLRWPDFSNETKSLRLFRPESQAESLCLPALKHLQGRLQQTGQAVRLLGLGVCDFVSQDQSRQLELFDF